MAKGLMATTLIEHKAEILAKWLDQALLQYPAMTQPGQFQNPIGYRLKESLSVLLDGLMNPEGVIGAQEALEGIMRIGAVQDSSASRAVVFVFALKQIIRTRFGDEIAMTFDNRIDVLALQAFDLFVKCREQLYELKINESRRMNFLITKHTK
jgi:hypothetical protein